MIASLRLCPIFITRSSSLNSRKLLNVRPSRATTWRRSTISILKTSGSKKNLRSLKGRWNCRRKRPPRNYHVERQSRDFLLFNNERFLDSARNDKRLIRRVFFLDRLGAAHFCFFAGATFLVAVRLLSFVNFLEDICDHRRRGAAAVLRAANVAFVERREREPRLIGR